MKSKDSLCNLQENKFTCYLYKTVIGRCLLKVLVQPFVSNIVGCFLNTKFSARYISSFIKKNNIDLEDYDVKKYKSFNDFFTRKLKHGARTIDYNKNSFISPCDARLLVYDINEENKFSIKSSIYTVEDLLQNKELAKEYVGGKLFVFRLCVNDYHRYCYIDNGIKSKNIHIKGELHTVRPIAMEKYMIYKKNTREYTILSTENFGDICQVEVGAMLVGKIKNLHQEASFKKGEEKGMFEFGGSTIVILVKEKALKIEQYIQDNSANEKETLVKLGQKIGEKI